VHPAGSTPMTLPPPAPTPTVRLATASPDATEATTSAAVLGLTTTHLWVTVAILAWALAGVGAAILLGRRGHHLRSLLGLAVVLGPLFLPLAWEFVRNREPAARVIALDPPPVGGGGGHAVVAVLGMPESVVDALPVLESFGPIGAVTLVATIDFESADRAGWDEVKDDAERRLTAAAAFVTDLRPSRVLAPGTLETALGRFVTADHDLIVVTGATSDVGSERLSAGVGIPVVVAPRLRERH
jgi:hypothetical protein